MIIKLLLDVLKDELALLIIGEAVSLEYVGCEEGLQVLYADLPGSVTETKEGSFPGTHKKLVRSGLFQIIGKNI
jgi:hypothetical protein